MFTVDARCRRTAARAGTLRLPHGRVETPAFMPVGTQGTVKSILAGELRELGYSLVLGNTYHLSLRPGEDLVAEAGGLHRFAGWGGALLTDSGGFQVFSLARLRRIGADGVEFRSHIDGSPRLFTPERVMEIQRKLGADVVMAFDECVPYPCERTAAEEALERTHRWAERCADAHDAAGGRAAGGWPQALFGIVQGSVYRDLRESSARALAALGLPGYAIGGLAVGEGAEVRNACVAWSTARLPEGKPRYLMGVGTPRDILDAVERGVDMFDCVLPTRNGRNGQVFTSEGVLNLRNARFARDFERIDPACGCAVCSLHSRAYVRHLFLANEILGPRLATYHNLAFYAGLMRGIRTSIHFGRFPEFAECFLERHQRAAGDPGLGGHLAMEPEE
ncbi:MAG: tRNA guanosine(34) transglycosylase Tgt [Chthonomonadales bacterium]|nr:tRNA guanosine(34) transglycosylase Tgt [Chthonomonadales bacterium]